MTVAATVMVLGLLGALVAVAFGRAGDTETTLDSPRSTDTVPTTGASRPVDATTAPDRSETADMSTADTSPNLGGGLVEPVAVHWEESSSPWDDVVVAPGTVGWYELDLASLPVNLRDRLGAPTAWDPAYAARFLRCTSWQAGAGSVTDGTLAAADVTCDGLSGGYSEFVDFGDVLAVGSGAGSSTWSGDAPTTAESLLWGLADGSLWGYETYPAPPEPTRHDLGGATALSYRSGDHAYLVVEPTPGTFAWLHGRDLDDNDLETLALHLQPADLPASLPVPLVLGSDINQGQVGAAAQLKLVWLRGRACVGLQLSEECTPTDDGPTLVRGSLSDTDQHPSVAAVVPAGHDVKLTVDLFGIDQPQPVPRAFIGVGIVTFVYPPGNERLVAAHLIDSDGAIAATTEWGIESMINGFAPDLIAEGRTDDEAWVVIRQDPAWTGPAPTTRYRQGSYCWLLFEAGGGQAPLCPPAQPPATALGTRADYHDHHDLIEVAADVSSLTCDGVALDILTDDRLAGRRFVVAPCDDPRQL